MRVKCLAQEHNTMTRLVLEPGPLDPESSALTTRPPRLFIIHFFKVKDTRDEYLCNFTLDSSNQHQQQENTSILITRFLNYKHRSLCFDSTAPFQAILFYVTGGGRGGGYLIKFCTGMLRTEVGNLPFYIPLLTKKYTVKPVLSGHPRDPR